ncbi:MAG: CHASE3 domain-containing protein, partial [Flavobacterium sp.]
MKMTLGRKIIIGFAACAVVLIAVAIFTFKNSEKYIASNSMVNHSNLVLSEFEQILVSSVDAESGTRGFVITGNDDFLQSYSEANSKVMEHLNKARELTKDNPNQQKNIEELEEQVKLRVTHLNRSIELRKENFEKAKEIVASGEGKQIQENIVKIVNRAKEIEQTLLVERKQTSEDDASNFNLVFIIFLLIIISILIIVYNIITTNISALKRAEAENASKNWLLTGNAELNEKLIGDKSVEQLANSTISFLCSYLKANIGAVYLFDEKDRTLVLGGQYAFSSPKDIKEKFTLNEGLIGQAAWEKKQISLTDVSENQIRITSSVMDAKPKHLL